MRGHTAVVTTPALGLRGQGRGWGRWGQHRRPPGPTCCCHTAPQRCRRHRRLRRTCCDIWAVALLAIMAGLPYGPRPVHARLQAAPESVTFRCPGRSGSLWREGRARRESVSTREEAAPWECRRHAPQVLHHHGAVAGGNRRRVHADDERRLRLLDCAPAGPLLAADHAVGLPADGEELCGRRAAGVRCAARPPGDGCAVPLPGRQARRLLAARQAGRAGTSRSGGPSRRC